MAHSKRNTSLAFFTSHERSLLKHTWGSQSTRLTRDSFLPFGACRLCLLRARDPVCCATHGDIYCRECAVANLLAQRQEIKRLEAEERSKDEERKLRKAEGEEAAREREVREFEALQEGSNGGKRNGSTTTTDRPQPIATTGVEEEGPRGAKRKFALDEDEVQRNQASERQKARLKVEGEKAAASKSALPSFWVPSLTPSTDPNAAETPIAKLNPLCPASTVENKHELSLKGLVAIRFVEAEKAKSSTSGGSRICPLCSKGLSNATKAFVGVPCGDVVCAPCIERTRAEDAAGVKRCLVCEADLGDREGKKKKEGKKLRPDLVPINCEGTGFAGGGANMVQKQGTVFQC